MRRRGFTLLEVLVATFIMGVAVTALLASLSTSLRNAARLTAHERAALLAKRKMEELLLDERLPRMEMVGGNWDPSLTGGLSAGWRAHRTPFEMPPSAGPGARVLDRIELEIWWMEGETRRTFTLEGFRSSVLRPQDLSRPGGGP